MLPLGLCTLELRQMIEQAFLPRTCHCRIGPDESLTVEVFDTHTGHVDLMVTGISLERMDCSRAINTLIVELRQELEHNTHTFAHAS